MTALEVQGEWEKQSNIKMPIKTAIVNWTALITASSIMH